MTRLLVTVNSFVIILRKKISINGWFLYDYAFFMLRISISKTCNVSKTGFDHGFMDEILWCINSLNGSSVIRCFFCIFLVVVSHHSVELSRLTIESGHYLGSFDLGSLSLVSDKKSEKKVWSVKFGRKLGRATRQSNFYYDIVQMRQEIIYTILRLSWMWNTVTDFSIEQNSTWPVAHVFTSQWLLKCPEGKDSRDQRSSLVPWWGYKWISTCLGTRLESILWFSVRKSKEKDSDLVYCG